MNNVYSIVGTYKDSASHSGILGQKRGERRYQNLDGTYTQEGLERKRAARAAMRDTIKELSKYGDSANKAANKYVESTKHKVFTGDSNYKNMSYNELNDVVKRLDLEKRYLDHTTKEVTDKGAEKVKEIVAIIGAGLVAVSTGLDIADKLSKRNS